ncbi:hypothetical protein INR49_000725 [Caranx melampygus]|nr:hypothetical protein INR49_000725 [Caranx melampygus]
MDPGLTARHLGGPWINSTSPWWTLDKHDVINRGVSLQEVPPSPHPRNAQALGTVWEWSVRELGVGPLRAKQRKRVLNVRHVVHGALNHR